MTFGRPFGFGAVELAAGADGGCETVAGMSPAGMLLGIIIIGWTMLGAAPAPVSI